MSSGALTSTTAAKIPHAADGRSCTDEHGGLAMPLRLIDVEATIKNREKGGIYFTRRQSWHVISHTWSADVREFSKIVGDRLKCSADRGDRRSYEELFEAADLSGYPSYQKFVEFLIILRADEVRCVWFDAVCINQTDLEEKNKEIQQMGLYYERSIGSHVVHHGIGKGFKVLNIMGDGVLPRWFSRAWTFQEWVLPQKTTFIIDLASEETFHRTASTILLRERGGCPCCNYEKTFNPAFIRECMHSHGANAKAGNLVSISARAQPFCRLKGSGQAHFRKIRDRKDWYFTDDLGYVFMVRVGIQMKNAQIDNVWPGMYSGIYQQKHALSDAEFKLTDRLGVQGFFRGISAHAITREKKMLLAIEEISARDCSNPEDRVLSVLKLLGVEGAIQVRSGKSLEEQIIDLARSLVKKGAEYQEMVLQLCLADGFGNDTRGMSWAPHFEVKKGSWQEGARQLAEWSVKSEYFTTFEARARATEVYMAGELRLVSDAVCAGYLISYEHDFKVDKDRRKVDELFKAMALQVEGQVVLHLCARVSAQCAADACVLENVSTHAFQDGSSGIVIMAPGIQSRLHELRERIPVWLVKMGVGERNTYLATYFLVCLGHNLQSPLHKIGYVGISSNIVSGTKLSENHQTICFIGGLGKDLSKHLFHN